MKIVKIKTMVLDDRMVVGRITREHEVTGGLEKALPLISAHYDRLDNCVIFMYDDGEDRIEPVYIEHTVKAPLCLECERGQE